MALKACDRCHWSKEKCSLADDDTQICAKCRRLKVACTVSREKGRTGRRPSAKSFPHGNVHIWSVDARPRSQPEDNYWEAAPAPGREKRRRSTSAAELEDPGQTGALGRRVPVVAPEPLLVPRTSLRTTSDAMRTVMDVEQFSTTHLPFMAGPSFIPDLRSALYSILPLSAPALTEGYLAFLRVMTRHQNALVMRRQELNTCQAAKGLQNLRDLETKQIYDAACALVLGQVMFVFDVLTAEFSSTAHSIVRSSLMSAKQWYQQLIRYRVMDTLTVCPVLIDTVECLVRREVPVIRFPLPDRIIVDRYAGVCSSLLPHLYVLCERSHALKEAALDTRARYMLGFTDYLADIEQCIRMWKPATPPRFFDEYDRHEVMIMLTQAKTYRLAALLVIHRLRYPFGVEDESAQRYANDIFSEIWSLAQSAGNFSTALPVAFPLVLAMFEVDGPELDILDSLSSYTVQSICVSKLRGFVNHVRESRKCGFDGTWFDLVEGHLNVAIIP